MLLIHSRLVLMAPWRDPSRLLSRSLPVPPPDVLSEPPADPSYDQLGLSFPFGCPPEGSDFQEVPFETIRFHQIPHCPERSGYADIFRCRAAAEVLPLEPGRLTRDDSILTAITNAMGQRDHKLNRDLKVQVVANVRTACRA